MTKDFERLSENRQSFFINKNFPFFTSHGIIVSMKNKFFLTLFILFAGVSALNAVELSGTYNKDFRVTTEFNTVSAGKTLRVTNGATFIMTDAIVTGSIIVEKGASLIGPRDGQGYLVFGKGTHVEGIDLYYKVRVSDNLVFTRKFPMTLDEVWKSNNKELIDWVSIIEFCYSTSLKGWVSINEVRFVNPFNEDLFDEYDMVFTKSASQKLEKECRSLIIKNKANIVAQSVPDYWGTKINKSIEIESGSSLVATGPDGHKLQIKPGITIKGLPLFVRYNNDFLPADTILSDIWKQRDFINKDYLTIYYKPELEAWVFDEVLYGDTVTDSLKKKLEALKK